MNTDLSFVSTEKLLEEITNRSTFAGVIIQSEQQHLIQDQVHTKFKIYSSIDKDEVKKLLGHISMNITE